MGQMKRKQEDEQTKESVAISIALHTGTIRHCVDHNENYYAGSEDQEAAYKYGNKLFRVNYSKTFATNREMTDCIKKVCNEHTIEDTCRERGITGCRDCRGKEDGCDFC